MNTKHHTFGHLNYEEEVTKKDKAILALSLATVVVSIVLESMGIL